MISSESPTKGQTSPLRVLKENFTGGRMTPNTMKDIELAKLKERNQNRFDQIMNEINQPSSRESVGYRSRLQQPVDVPDQIKWDYDDKGQQALNELQEFFSRNSACSDEESEKDSETPTMKFKVTKLGFDKTPKSSDTKEAQSPIKFSLSDFQILHTLGKGSSGVVKLAKHKKKNWKVVFKIYEKYKLIESQLKKSLFKEIELLQSISHPNIIKLYDVIEDERHIYLIMEYISGGSLQQQMRARTKKLSEVDAKKIFKQLSSAIKYLHSQK